MNCIIASSVESGASRTSLIKLLQSKHTGNYYRDGVVRQELAADIKTSEKWELTVNGDIAIDGHQYQCEKVRAEVIKDLLPIYI